jgi:hypothetical protein
MELIENSLGSARGTSYARIEASMASVFESVWRSKEQKRIGDRQ